MFPFIWWLGEQADPAQPVDGGGEDFLRRRAIMAIGTKRGNALPFAPLAWYHASAPYVTLDANGLVGQWSDRGPLGLHLTAALEAERPTWEASGGWAANKSSIQFPGGKNLGASSAIATNFNGSDVPFWLFVTAEVTSLAAERTIACWDDAAVAQSKCWLTSTDGFSSYTRVDDASSSVSANAAASGSGVNTHRRMGWVFSGTTVTTYMDLVTTLTGAAANVGALTASRLRVGDGLGAGDSFVGRIAEIVVGTGSPAPTDWLRYYYYSLGEWG